METKIDEILGMDFKMLEHLLNTGAAEKFISSRTLLLEYDPRSLDDLNDIESAKGPLYVLHNFDGISFEYSPVYNNRLELVGFLD